MKLSLRNASSLALGALLVACSSSSPDAAPGDGGTTSTTPNPNGSDVGAECAIPSDCKSGVCTGSTCVDPEDPTASHTDGKANLGETDVDCGGDTKAPRCAKGKKCEAASDCAGAIACHPTKKVCSGPAYDDGLKNGAETDVDCGGDAAHPCDVGKACKAHADCKTGCDDEGKCATAASCTQLHGGRTCGPTGDQDCCATAKQGTYTLDKYLITAGRMRAFLDRHGGNVRAFVDALPPGKWNAAWNYGVSIDGANANFVMGGTSGKRSCIPGFSTGRTYWTPPNGDDFNDYPQAVLDDKALNCVPWPMLKAMCIADGGHLATVAELRAAFTNGGTTKYPWGNAAYDPICPYSNVQPGQCLHDPRLIANYSYATPNPPAGARKLDSGQPGDIAFFIAPPGSRPAGDNAVGIADAAGNLLEFVGDADRRFVWKSSWEQHGHETAYLIDPKDGHIWDENPQWVWGTRPGPRAGDPPSISMGYYAIGGRCAY